MQIVCGSLNIPHMVMYVDNVVYVMQSSLQ